MHVMVLRVLFRFCCAGFRFWGFGGQGWNVSVSRVCLSDTEILAKHDCC